MHVRFWGVRGSIPWATAASIRVGCNTPCIEVRDDSSPHTLVLDAGSGIVGLGAALADRTERVDLLLTHYHRDHLQGLPFFGPLFARRPAPAIWAPAAAGRSPIESFFDAPFHPLPYAKLPSPPAIHDVRPGALRIGAFEIRAQPLNHPGGSLAYRISGHDGDLVYATDHEFGDEAIDGALGRFIAGARAVILDAHYTPEERAAHRGWGHGDWAQCARFAAAHGAGRLWLFHHKPGRTDAELREVESKAREIFAAAEVAEEGKTFSL